MPYNTIAITAGQASRILTFHILSCNICCFCDVCSMMLYILLHDVHIRWLHDDFSHKRLKIVRSCCRLVSSTLGSRLVFCAIIIPFIIRLINFNSSIHMSKSTSTRDVNHSKTVFLKVKNTSHISDHITFHIRTLYRSAFHLFDK